jgi:hypothetical protein
MRASVTTVLLLGALLACTAAHAQTPRKDAIWARSTNGAAITLDGHLTEPAWAVAESVVIRYGYDTGIPGSGFQYEGGRIVKDSTYAVVRFLTAGNYLYVSAVCRDSSIGGDTDFNRNDGLLMQLKDHTDPNRPTTAREYMYSWWSPVDSVNAHTAGGQPCLRGFWAPADSGNLNSCERPWARTPEMIDAWDAACFVEGIANQDTVPGGITPQVDTRYTMELKFGLTAMGYDITGPEGGLIEYGIQIKDADYVWDTYQRFLKRFGSNRTWWQSPWANDSWYGEVKVYARPDVNVTSGPVPVIGPEVRVANAGAWPAPAIDGYLNDPIWSLAPKFDVRFGDDALRLTYPGVGPWRSGQFQPEVNGGQAYVADPGDATVRWFYKADTLYFGIDVRDQYVQYVPLPDRYDGIQVNLDDRVARWRDNNLEARWLTYIVGAAGTGLALDYLPYLRDTANGARVALHLKGATTVDTIGFAPDSGYTMELAIDLTKLGYPSGLGDRILFPGVKILDGDSFGASTTDSYGERAWWFWGEYRNCCPAWAYLDPSLPVAVDQPTVSGPQRLQLLGNAPNPFRTLTTIRYSLAATSDVSLEIYDVAGRLVTRRAMGYQSAGTQQIAFSNPGLHAGLYLYRLRAADPISGTERASSSGKMLLVR